LRSVAKIITGKETDLANCLKVMDIDLNKQFKNFYDKFIWLDL